jgi:hypothetical protein
MPDTPDTIVIQSHKSDPGGFVLTAVESVRAWAAQHGHAYECIDDALFDLVPEWCVDAAHGRMQMVADIVRLIWIMNLLDAGWSRVVWLDADVHVFRPTAMNIDAPEGYAFGHEDWIQPGRDGNLKTHRNVHNALLIFTPAGRVTLDFYLQSALSLLGRGGPDVPPQFVGPKLLTALHNVVGFPLSHTVGMASPLVLRDLAAGGGPAWEMLLAAHDNHGGGDLAALNLCASLLGSTVDGVEITERLMTDAIAYLDTLA